MITTTPDPYDHSAALGEPVTDEGYLPPAEVTGYTPTAELQGDWAALTAPDVHVPQPFTPSAPDPASAPAASTPAETPQSFNPPLAAPSQALAAPARAELIDAPNLSGYPVLVGKGDAGLVLRENMGKGGLTEFDLDKIKVPSGGGLAWQIPGLTGMEITEKITGVIVHHKDVRAFWQERFDGANNPPDCSSRDAEIGVGTFGRGSAANPTGECGTCPMAQYGTAIDEKGQKGAGQACKQMKVLFMLREGEGLPAVIAAPPGSLKNLKQFLLRLAGKMLPYYSIVTELGLEQDKSTGGIIYSKIAPRMAAALTEEETERTRAFGSTIRQVFNDYNDYSLYDNADS